MWSVVVPVVVPTCYEILEGVLEAIGEMLEAAETGNRATCGTRVERINLPPLTKRQSRVGIDRSSDESGSNFERSTEAGGAGDGASDASDTAGGCPDDRTAGNSTCNCSSATSDECADATSNTAEGKLGDRTQKWIPGGSPAATC